MKVCSNEQEFINIVAEPAQNACRKIGGFLPSVLIGQSFLELGAACPDNFDNDGIYDLLEANNMVGIKAELLNDSWSDKTIWDGSYIEKETPEYENGKLIHIVDKFRKYKSIEDSFYDYLLFLKYGGYEKGKPKYGDSVLKITIPEELIRRVNELGYATDPNYWKEVMGIVNRYNLTKYDLEEVSDEVLAEHKYPVIDHRSYKDAYGKVTVPKGNTHEFVVVHYLGVTGQNDDLHDGRYGGHAYIAWDGTITLRVPDDGIIWAVGASSGWKKKREDANNETTYNIEMCCKNPNGYCPEDEASQALWYFTQETQEAAVQLVRQKFSEYGWALSRASVDKHLLRHGDITTKPCPMMYTRYDGTHYKTNWAWEEFKCAVVTGICPNSEPRERDDTYMFECKTIKKGSTGNDVYLARCILRGRKWKTADSKLVTTGTDFDAALETVVKRFQKKMGLDADGIIGPDTWKALLKR